MAYTLSILIFSTQIAIGQKTSYTGKTFINEKLDQIDFINDSIVRCSFRAFPEKYSFLNDSLQLTMLHHFSDMEFQHSYKLLYYSSDSLFFIYHSLSAPDDTMKMVNIQKYIHKLEDFDSLKVDMFGPLLDFRRLIIYKDRTVKVGKSVCDTWKPDDRKCMIYKYAKLSEARYREFLDTLSKSLIFMIPPDRGDGGIDAPTINFIIHTNGRTIVSEGKGLSSIHSKLVGYLCKEFINKE